MWFMLLRCTLLLALAGTGTFVHALTASCSEGNGGYYDNSRNCTFRNVIVDDVATTVTFSSGSGYRYNTPYHFRFVDSKLIEVPRKIFDSYSTVQLLGVAECSIESISRYTFEKASSLLLLNLSTNSLQEVKNYVFTGASSLNHLDLSNNNISVIEEKAFANLYELTSLFLAGNSLKALEEAVFAPLTKLRKISMARNQLQILSNELFLHNTALTMVFLQNNQLVMLEKDMFQNVEGLEYLWLKNNNLTSLEFNDLNVKIIGVTNNQLKKIKLNPSVQQLFASNNSISTIEADDFAKLKIKSLDLAWNNLTSLDSISQITAVELMDLSHNALGPLKLTSFAKLTNLIDLNLEDTKISNLQHGTFSQLSSLKRLDISYNKLNRIDVDIFTSSHHLEELYIDGNRLKEFSYQEIQKIFPQMNKISIADNYWNCTFLTKMIRSLNTQTIVVGGFKSESLIADKTNVKGIYCTDDTNPLNEWNTTLKHLDKYLNNSEPIVDTTEIKQIMQNAIDDIEKFNEQKMALANTSEKLEGEILDLTKKQLALENDLIQVKQTILDVKLSQLQNATTNDTFVSGDLKRMMTELNVLTETKFNLTSQKLELKIYEQSFKIDKFMDKINENAEKLLILRKQLDQAANPAFASYNPVMFQGLKSEPSTAGSSHTLTIVIMGTLIVLLVAALAVLYRKSRRVTLRGKSCYSTSNTLATMMDNDI
ncbi:toll-like receptor 3 [Culex pipiens pallens]|uniref:toll-like receptor 3 n=1 Tax=Culex pipiens pallens TaxID=42434 RepID=UPI001954214E|nr:toll-like receptor 3 [Culex pipiens pallens]